MWSTFQKSLQFLWRQLRNSKAEDRFSEQLNFNMDVFVISINEDYIEVVKDKPEEIPAGEDVGETILNETFHCPHCPKSYENRREIRTHIKNHEKANVKTCSVYKCGFSFESQDLKEQHEKNEHAESEISSHQKFVPCPYSDVCKIQHEPQWMGLHIRRFHRVKPITCVLHPRIFYYENEEEKIQHDLKVHQKIH
ncbi:Hypothetical predicted protein [Cloeon dipterum]|uniref:C2H2-type domain-containing protein n=1 Tax=Cloeon dipterum TaxID=197152 RepID=A0A8S1E1U5_9INSE|nr:Hypothetical predicted protein [Cloeon dipterum]